MLREFLGHGSQPVRIEWNGTVDYWLWLLSVVDWEGSDQWLCMLRHSFVRNLFLNTSLVAGLFDFLNYDFLFCPKVLEPYSLHRFCPLRIGDSELLYNPRTNALQAVIQIATSFFWKRIPHQGCEFFVSNVLKTPYLRPTSITVLMNSHIR
jgi:hypothetical protein